MTGQQHKPPSQDGDGGKAPGFWQVVQSVNAAFFGVQTGSNRERDFKRGKASHFIAVGLVMTVLFVLMVIGVVRLVLRGAGL